MICFPIVVSAATITNPSDSTVNEIIGSQNSTDNSSGGNNMISNQGSVVEDIFGSLNTGNPSSGSGNIINNSGMVGENIYGSYNFGISSNGGGNTVNNSGSAGIDIIGSYNRGHSSYGGGNTVDNSGMVSGDVLGNWNTGDFSRGGGNTVNNTGTVSADIYGSYNSGESSSGGENTISNSGMVGTDIIGSYNRGESSSGGGNTIDNSGTVNGDIIGSWNSGNLSSSTGNSIINSGTVAGNIYGSLNQGGSSSGGDDIITNSGHVGGSIYGNDGNDTITFLGGFSLGGLADGGSGNDTLGFNNVGNVNGTSYINFENLGIFGGTNNLTGTWDLSGGNTTIHAGNLYVNGIISTNLLTVSPGSLLGGSGQVNGAVVNYGTISPGNSVGTLTVNNSISFMPGSLYLVELQPNGEGDLIRASGTVNINGGSVQAILYRGLYYNGQNWQIISAGGGVKGAFNTLATNLNSQTLNLRLLYDTGQVMLETVRTPFADLGITPNQKGVGYGLDAVVPYAKGDMASLIISMDFDMNLGQIQSVLNGLNPEMYTSFRSAGIKNGRISDKVTALRQAEVRLHSQFDMAAAENELDHKGWNLWTRVLGNTSEYDSEDDYMGYNQDITGVIVGADGVITDWLLGGLSIGYSDSDLEWDGDSHSGSIKGMHAGIYGTFDFNGYFLDSYLGYSGLDNSASRDIIIYGFSARTRSDFDSSVWQGRIKGGYDFKLDNWLFSPFVSADYAYLEQDSFDEAGADYLNLHVEEGDTESLASTLGIRFSGILNTAQWQFLPSAQVSWLHEYKDDPSSISSNYVDYSSSKFNIYGQAPVSDLGIIDVGLISKYGQNLSLYLDYGFALASGYNSHLISCGLSWQF